MTTGSGPCPGQRSDKGGTEPNYDDSEKNQDDLAEIHMESTFWT
jgi:hypothetical protein